jgi:NhaP-type Na+/H+ or K+/H+ antiporter
MSLLARFPFPLDASAAQLPLLYALVGMAMFAAAFLPRLLWRLPLSMPIVLVAFGYTVFALPLGLPRPDPQVQGYATEKLCEAVVIVSLMGAGLKIDRPFQWRAWRGTWRLLGITMPLTIAATALAGWGLSGLAPAAALLLGAVIAPTDPVLATEIQVGPPQRGSHDVEVHGNNAPAEKEEDEFRFILTSEAGLNDGMAFPFVHAALALAISAARGDWVVDWALGDVAYRLVVGGLSGALLGSILGRLILAIPARSRTAIAMVGPGALAATLMIYGVTESLAGYGFLAVFVGALAIRDQRREHRFHEALHSFSEMAERVLTAVVLFAFGGAIAGGLLAPLDASLVITAILTVVLIRPLAGMIGLAGFNEASGRERWAISFFGVRGIGSLYYLAYALGRQEFVDAERLWAFTALVVLISILLHGILATPIVRRLDRRRSEGPSAG